MKDVVMVGFERTFPRLIFRFSSLSLWFLERSASAEFHTVNRSVRVHQATEV